MAINYSHDIATAFLAVSGAMMLFLSKLHSVTSIRETDLVFVKIYEVIRKSARYSLEWILIAGVPRIIFYQQVEWSPMAGDLQVIAIGIKHIAMFLIVGVFLYYWANLNRRVKALKMKHQIA
jgi:sterol desaturase/sphingolipid hydroxylase (fatty acid hydroxylase superfamily)